MTPDTVLDWIAGQERVKLPESAVAEGLGIAKDDAAGLAELQRMLSALKDAGDICRWVAKNKPVVTLSSITAYRRRLRLNPSSTRWVAHGTEDGPDRNKSRRTTDGAKVMCESDMAEEPPGTLANMPDRRTEATDDPDFGLALVIADERMMGLVRPTLPLVGVKPWTAEDWERDHDVDGKAFPGGGAGRLPRGGLPVCPVCNGRELREMISLTPVRVGKNRAPRPAEVVDGGEFCARCSRHYQDNRWPRVTRLPDTAKGRAGK